MDLDVASEQETLTIQRSPPARLADSGDPIPG
jgi:hypothetical protein